MPTSHDNLREPYLSSFGDMPMRMKNAPRVEIGPGTMRQPPSDESDNALWPRFRHLTGVEESSLPNTPPNLPRHLSGTSLAMESSAPSRPVIEGPLLRDVVAQAYQNHLEGLRNSLVAQYLRPPSPQETPDVHLRSRTGVEEVNHSRRSGVMHLVIRRSPYDVLAELVISRRGSIRTNFRYSLERPAPGMRLLSAPSLGGAIDLEAEILLAIRTRCNCASCSGWHPAMLRILSTLVLQGYDLASLEIGVVSPRRRCGRRTSGRFLRVVYRSDEILSPPFEYRGRISHCLSSSIQGGPGYQIINLDLYQLRGVTRLLTLPAVRAYQIGRPAEIPVRAVRPRRAQVLNYSYKPVPVFHTDGVESADTALFLGVELEVDDPGCSLSSNRIAELAAQHLGSAVYTKGDGSLENGAEIVSHPATFNWWTNNRPIVEALLKDLRAGGWQSNAARTCGMHVHMSNSAFESKAHHYRFLHLIYRFPALSLFVSQRAENQIRQWASLSKRSKVQLKAKAGLTPRRSDDDASRYEAVNVTRWTSEVRIFRGTLLAPRFYKNLQFLAAAFQFTKETALLRSVTARKFIAWIQARTEQYGDLVTFLKDVPDRALALADRSSSYARVGGRVQDAWDARNGTYEDDSEDSF